MLSDDLICILSGQGARMDGSDFNFQVDLIHAVDQMDGYPADSCAISPTAFLLFILHDWKTKLTNENLSSCTRPQMRHLLFKFTTFLFIYNNEII